MRVLTSKVGDFSSNFDKTNEKIILDTTLKELLNDNHTIQANKVTVFDQLRLERGFRCLNSFEKVIKGLEFDLTFERLDWQNLVYTSWPQPTITKMKINKNCLFVPSIIRNPERQINFNNSNKNSFTLSDDSWTTYRRVIYNQLEYQLDMRSALDNKSLKWLTAAHQTALRTKPVTYQFLINLMFGNFVKKSMLLVFHEIQLI